jgi:hypothetical protein
MSLTDVRTYFRTRMDSLNYEEWPDGFNFQNIPQTIINGAYHLETGEISSGPANQMVHRFLYPVLVRVFLRGYADPASAIDDAISQSETILADVLKASNRLSDIIQDVVPNTVSIVPLDPSNDNDLILEMDFTANVVCNFT